MKRVSSLQEAFSFVRKPQGGPVLPPFDPGLVSSLARKGVFLGTLSWRYRGWEGMLYRGGYANEGEFQREALREYAQLLPALGVELTQHAWPSLELVGHLLESTPDSFRFVVKVPAQATLPFLPPLPAFGRHAGKPNPELLDAEVFSRKLLAPLERLRGRVGALLFELPGHAGESLSRLAGFFSALPRGFPMAAGLGDGAPLTPELAALLVEQGIGPALFLRAGAAPPGAHWAAYEAAGGAAGKGPVVVVAVVPPERRPEEAIPELSPYRERRRPYPVGTQQLGHMAAQFAGAGREAFFLVHNHWEGSAIASLGAIAAAMGEEISR